MIKEHVFQFFSLFLKVAREGACLRSSSSSFQSLGPRKDIAFCPFLVFRSGSERSVSVFLSSLTFRVEFRATAILGFDKRWLLQTVGV